MRAPVYTPLAEAWTYLPADYFDMPIEQRARALQAAGRKMADDIFRQSFAATAEETNHNS